MSIEDLQFAVQVTEQIGWGMSEADFEFMMELEPEGCFVLFEDQERIGLATNMRFGPIAWFGNLIVSEDRRKRGAGSLLLKHSIDYLLAKGVKTVGLYAYMDKVQFYRKHGFESDSNFLVLTGRASFSPPKTDMRPAGKKDLPDIIAYDRTCFGASRAKLLEPILSDRDNLCYVAKENGHLTGYVVAKVYRGMAELGPLVCSKGRSDVAIDLLASVLGRLKGMEVSLFAPEKEVEIINMLTDAGFMQRFKVARMFLGPSAATDCICFAESLERG